VVATAWSVSLWQVIAWPCLILSGAWMVSDHLAAGILSAGLLAGILFGVWSLRVQATSSAPATNAPVTREPVRVIREPSDRRQSPISALAWFTLGLIGALCLTFAIAWVASFLRGPIQGHNEWGTLIYTNEQFFVNLGGGLAVLTIGWGTGIALRRLKAPRGLTWGIVVGTTPLALMFACGF